MSREHDVAMTPPAAASSSLAAVGRSRWVELRDGLAAARVARLAGARVASPAPVWAALRRILSGEATAPADALDAIAREATRQELAGLVQELAPALGPALAPAVARQKRHHALLELATEQIGAALASTGLGERVALLKGSASSVRVYAEPWQRARRDIDLLVQPGDFAGVRTTLWNAGWRDAIVRETGGPPGSGRTFGMRLALGPAVIHLDLHRNLVTRPWCGLVGPAFRGRFLEAAERGRAALPVTSAEHTLLHTVAHLVHSGFSAAPKGLIDLWRLAETANPEAVIREAAAFGLGTATWALLGVVARWFEARLPWDLDALAPHGGARRLFLRRLLRGEGPSPMPGPIARRALVQGLPRLLMDRDFEGLER